jgi:hypothetical protein
MNDNVVAFVSRWRGRYRRGFVVGSCPAARRRQWAWESLPFRQRQFHRYRTVAAHSTRIRRPDAFAHRGAPASRNARSKTARSRRRTQTEIEAGPSLSGLLGRPLWSPPVGHCGPLTALAKRNGATKWSPPTPSSRHSCCEPSWPPSPEQTDDRFCRRVVDGSLSWTFRRSGPLSRPGPLRGEGAPLPAVRPSGGRQSRSTSRHFRTTGPP